MSEGLLWDWGYIYTNGSPFGTWDRTGLGWARNRRAPPGKEDKKVGTFMGQGWPVCASDSGHGNEMATCSGVSELPTVAGANITEFFGHCRCTSSFLPFGLVMKCACLVVLAADCVLKMLGPPGWASRSL